MRQSLHNPLATEVLCACILLLSFVGRAWSSEADALFLRGNEYYQKGEFRLAIDEYQKILDLGFESWEVYYNIGNAYFKQGKIAQAILNFERAKQLNPENEDINFNLDLANLSTADRIEELPQFFLSAWIARVANMVNLRLLGYLTLAVYLGFVALVILRILVPSLRSSRAVSFGVIVGTIFLCFFSGILSLRIYEIESTEEAILLPEKIDVKSAPGEAGTDVFTLHEGVKVQIQDRSLDWVKIRLADGKIGWVKEAMIEKI
ncbi:MAG: tetratricopeptide repeat protein [bacterium]